MLALVVMMLGAFWLGTERGARAGGEGGGAVETVVVGRGETLWEIASRLRPRDDPRRVVGEIGELNGLRGSIVQPGQRLRVPRS
ncbi:LysM peptidoglycan-binding domain-containing protein [Thermomonospora umbrina]|uniref:LysM peptidoglycan-binding domain-containing protein n=1 Tax=Thermomonospora umbrina TaxID=111806 RepID=UPI001FEC57BC|nr:LysM peptidoglycan-binding domain-containing protein [Thermomonospora umbrina]